MTRETLTRDDKLALWFIVHKAKVLTQLDYERMGFEHDKKELDKITKVFDKLERIVFGRNI